MSKYKRNNKFSLVLWGLSWGLLAIAGKPAIAQEMEVVPENSQIQSIASVPISNQISTQAADLLSPVELPEYFTDTQTRTYTLGQLDLEKFCQDFPYNSKCQGTTPGMESEPNSIPVPVPPPAPPEDDRSSSSSGQRSGWAIAPEISTLGLGGHVVKRIIPQINARVGVNTFGVGFDIETDSDVDLAEDINADYDVDLNLFNVSTIADFHPFKSSGFKLSGGLVFANNNVEGTATTDQDIEIGGVAFNEDELGSVDVDVEVTRSVAPYLGIGWGNAVAARKGLGFWLNLGVMFGGSPEITVTPNINDSVPAETVNEINEAAQEEEEEIEDDLAFISIYPVASLGISFQF